MKKEITKLKKEVKKFYKDNDPAHDFLHVERVYRIAEKIGKQEKADLSVLLPAVLLHDVRKPVSKAIPIARKILRKLKFEKKRAERILHAIEAHSFSHGLDAESTEAEILQDSDRIDALGAIGVARCFTYGAIMGREFYSQNDMFCSKRRPDDRNYTLDHFFKKLLKLKSGLHTKSARKIAAKRHKFLLAFLRQIKSEVSQ